MFSQWNMLKYIKTFCYLVIFTKITLVHCSLCEVSVSFSKMCHVSLGRFWICFPLSPTVEVRWLVSMYISCGYLTCEMERELTVAPLLVFWSNTWFLNIPRVDGLRVSHRIFHSSGYIRNGISSQIPSVLLPCETSEYTSAFPGWGFISRWETRFMISLVMIFEVSLESVNWPEENFPF